MHESLDEFKFWPDADTNTRVICPCTSEKWLYNVVSTLAPSFLIGSSSYLQVTRTSIRSQTSSKFGQIGPRTCEHSSSFIFDLINLILAGKEDMHESLDEFEFRQICNRLTALD